MASAGPCPCRGVLLRERTVAQSMGPFRVPSGRPSRGQASFIPSLGEYVQYMIAYERNILICLFCQPRLWSLSLVQLVCIFLSFFLSWMVFVFRLLVSAPVLAPVGEFHSTFCLVTSASPCITLHHPCLDAAPENKQVYPSCLRCLCYIMGRAFLAHDSFLPTPSRPD